MVLCGPVRASHSCVCCHNDCRRSLLLYFIIAFFTPSHERQFLEGRSHQASRGRGSLRYEWNGWGRLPCGVWYLLLAL